MWIEKRKNSREDTSGWNRALMNTTQGRAQKRHQHRRTGQCGNTDESHGACLLYSPTTLPSGVDSRPVLSHIVAAGYVKLLNAGSVASPNQDVLQV